MCFCQYVLHREQTATATSTVVEHVKEQVASIKKNALKKSHRRRSMRTPTPPPHYIGPITSNNGTSKFGDRKSNMVTFM